MKNSRSMKNSQLWQEQPTIFFGKSYSESKFVNEYYIIYEFELQGASWDSSNSDTKNINAKQNCCIEIIR